MPDVTEMEMRLNGKVSKITRLYIATGSRVARWYIFKPNIYIWVNFGGP
jgi:hypothetical protein